VEFNASGVCPALYLIADCLIVAYEILQDRVLSKNVFGSSKGAHFHLKTCDYGSMHMPQAQGPT
jgi:hypothetical protein